MKLLFASTGRDRAGGAAYFLSLAQAMADAGHHVEALADGDQYIAHKLDEVGITWHHARFRNVMTPSANRALAAAIRRMQPDWLLNGSSGKEYWSLITHGKMHRIPVALFRHSARPMKRLSGYFLPRLAQRFITDSNFVKTVYMKRGVPAERVQWLHDSVDTVRFCPDAERGRKLRNELGIGDDAIVVGNVGRMYFGKGVRCLQQALAQAMQTEPRLHALWIGDGPEVDGLRRAIRTNGNEQRHHFLGWRTDTWRCYNAMSMLAFPTMMQEAFGQVSIEAQASGIPVLGSRIGGVPEGMDHGKSGLLLPVGDVDAWRDGILALCNDADRQRMGTAARMFVERHFSLPVIAESFARLLTQ